MMDKMDIAKGLIFTDLHLYNKNTLDNRVTIQKKIYLLQEQNVDLGYEYNWYLKGPYSPSLTSYVYDNLEILNSTDYTEYTLNAEVLRKIEVVNNFQNDNPKNLSEADWYELLASMVYIYKNSHMWGINNVREQVIRTLLNEKPKYTEEDCNFAFNILVNSGFVGEGM